MKHINKYILLLAVGAFIASCTPKVTAPITKPVMEEQADWRSTAPKSGPAKPIKMGKSTQTTLDNGLKLIVVENHKLPLINYQISLDSPPILEVDATDKTGYVDLAGSLMSTGTPSLTKAEIDAKVDNIGATLNTNGRGAFGQCLAKHSDVFLEIFSEVITDPIYDQEQFEKAVKRTLSGIQSNQDDPNAIAGIVRSKLVYGADHPYGNSATASSVNNITLEDVKGYHKSTFFPKNAYLIIVGDITPEEAKNQANKYFGSWKNPEAMPSYAPMPTPKAPKGATVDFVNKAGAVQSVINITYPVDLKTGDDDAIKASLMNAILGGGVFSSKLMQNLREDKAYTYGARSSLRVDPYQGSFNAFASVRNEVTDSSVVEFIKEMKAIGIESVTDENLEISKKFMIGTFARSISNPSTVARFALRSAKYNLPADYYEKYTERIQQVTKEDIKEMAKKYVTPDNAHILVVGSKADVADKLVQFDSDGEIDFYDTNGNFVKPEEETIPEGHTAKIVISDYMDAIGGMDKINGIQDMTTVYNSEVMGRPAVFTMIQAAPNMFMQEIKSGSMVMQKQVFDGKTLDASGMAGSQRITEGDMIEKAKVDALPVKQAAYMTAGFDMKLDGIDKVDGKSHYVVLIKKPTGESVSEYYNIKTGLLTKSVETMEAQGQSMTMTTNYTDYKEVNGIMFPQMMEILGMMPTPVVLKAEKIEVNTGVDKSIFEIK
ncbi:insulinase family protein [Saprospiraceae bacterium]|nr:insulinase family protein [Saprospiraceae bacterium]